MGGDTAVLGDFVSLIRGTTYKGALLGKEGPVLLGLATIAPEGGFRTGNYRTYGGESPQKLLLEPGEVFVSLKDVTQAGTLLGAVARVPAYIEKGRLTQDTVKLVSVNADINMDYIYWLLRTPQYRELCKERSTGTTNLGLSRDDFLSLPVPLLTNGRRDLCALLDLVEGKIELNRRMAETLESTARALYKSWFVDFDPVRAKIEGRPTGLSDNVAALFPESLGEDAFPLGWASTNASIGVPRRSAIQPADVDPETPYIGLEHIDGGKLSLERWGRARDVDSLKSTFRKGDLLFGKLRPYFHKVVIAAFDGICSSDIIVFTRGCGVPLSFLALAFSQTEFIAMASNASGGTRMPRADWGYMRAKPAVRPSDVVLQVFDHVATPLLERALFVVAQSRTLLALRDTLLPKLISDELHIRDAEHAVAAA